MNHTITQVFPYQFRNLEHAVIDCAPGINVFVGDNAQGKTNILELIYYAIHNKSFKSAKTQDIISTDQSSLTTLITLESGKLRINKTSTTTTITLNNSPISAIDASALVPMQVISPDRGYIIGGEQSLKRRSLNWGVFHVKPEFKRLYIAYQKIKKNINILIKDQNKSELLIWLPILAKHISQINNLREQYLQMLNTYDKYDYFENTDIDASLLHYTYSSSIPKTIGKTTEDIHEFLLKNIDFILKNKYLRYGPHRATLEFNYNNTPETNLSRGQQKILSVLFCLKQLQILLDLGKQPVVLIDDITSELDNMKIDSLLHFLKHHHIQSFITNIHPLPQVSTTNFVKSGKVEYNC